MMVSLVELEKRMGLRIGHEAVNGTVSLMTSKQEKLTLCRFGSELGER